MKRPRWPVLGSMASGAAGMLRSLGTGLGHLSEWNMDSHLSVGSSLFEGSARDVPSGWMICVCTPNSSCSSPAGLAGPRRDQHQAHLQGLRDYDRSNWCGQGKRDMETLQKGWSGQWVPGWEEFISRCGKDGHHGVYQSLERLRGDQRDVGRTGSSPVTSTL